MRRRSRDGQHWWSPRHKAKKFLARCGARKRKAFSIERLEDRFAFSATTAPLQFQMSSLSNDTPEGAAALWERELAWAIMQHAAAGSTASEITTYALPNDPLFPRQWHLENTGQDVSNPDFQDLFAVEGEDINVVEAWDLGYTGEGVVVAVIDSGVELDHPDLISNLHPTLRLNATNNSTNVTPSQFDPSAFHGTAVAGLIGAIANNGIGGTGVAPGVQLVPIKLSFSGDPNELIRAFQFGLGEIDITNNSWGPAAPRTARPLTVEEITALRDTIIFGRGGLGTIHVFAAGNDAGPGFVDGFEDFGALNSSTYNGWVNSRYTIGVTGVDHDGVYFNADGTFTSYAETSAAVLVAAPTGSNAAQNVADDRGQGSGIVTTDLTGEDGANAPPLNGFEFDRDFLPQTDYMSRFNGTSASAPIVSGVIALMLDANPNLSWRDVQEILVRSARQNAQFELASGANSLISESTWRTNQIGIFHDPDPFVPGINPVQAVFNPVVGGNSSPAVYTNGAGYTVSQGFGSYGEQIGYAHGVVDAGLAVKMAAQWHQAGQNKDPNTERTFTTFVDQILLRGDLPPAQKVAAEHGFGLVVPGALGGEAGFIDYWEEYFEEDDPADPDDGPFSGDDTPVLRRGENLTFSVPDSQAMNVDWVEVKVSIEGPPEDLDFLRILLVSPEGTQSELNHFYGDPSFLPELSTQGDNSPPRFLGVSQGMDPDGGNFVWTFSTNRNWGERTDNAVVIDPVTGEPAVDVFGFLQTRGWELHVENWSDSMFQLSALEVVWHGTPLAEGTQRVQGFVGLDTNNEENFNFSRTQQFFFGNPAQVRLGDVERELDFNQEPFAENMLVQAFRIDNGIEQTEPAAQFLTGADGNYYFDLVPDDYVIRVIDSRGRELLDDPEADSAHLPNFQKEWRISPDWFFAPDREDPSFSGPGAIIYDQTLDAPVKFAGGAVPMGIKNLNFLVKDEGPPPVFNISGLVFNDRFTNGLRDTGELGLGGIRVFIDADRMGDFDAGDEIEAITSSNGTFAFPDVAPGSYRIAVDTGSNWRLTAPELGYYEIVVQADATVSELIFGLDNLLDHDWGDLPDSYNTRADGTIDPARHFIITDGAEVPGFYLGSGIDGELAGGGDGLGVGELDNGVRIVTNIVNNAGHLRLGSNTLNVTVAGVGGILNGWIDWNDNKKFDASEHLVWEDSQGNFFSQIHLDTGQSVDLKITAPLSAASGTLAARFRWGEPGLDFFGPATHGEVEDYLLPSTIPVMIVGDFDRSGLVDEQDKLVWRATFGSTTDLRADANKDNVVDAADYNLWRKNVGASSGSSIASSSSLLDSSPAPAPGRIDATYHDAGALIQFAGLQASGITASGVAEGGAVDLSAVVHATSDSNSTSASLSAVQDGQAETPVSGRSPDVLEAFAVQVGETGVPMRVESTATAGVVALDRNLLLVDEAWADLEADESAEALIRRELEEDEDPLSDFALAAVFEEGDPWWGAI